jgi:hypothetical protein
MRWLCPLRAEHGVLNAQGLTIEGLTGSTIGLLPCLASACHLSADQSLNEPFRHFKSLGQQIRPLLEEAEDGPTVSDGRELKLEFVGRLLERTTDRVVGTEGIEAPHCG